MNHQPRPSALEPQHDPELFIDREEERATVITTVTGDHAQNLYLYGPRGTGKTRLVQHVLEAVPETVTTCYLSCIRYNTQYRVLNQLTNIVVGDDLNTGYHTTHLQRQLADEFTGKVVIVLDDVDFLLLNEGADLFYFLSRLDHNPITIVAVSANYPDIRAIIDERTYSTLQPDCLTLDPYPAPLRYQILAARGRHLFSRDQPFPKAALATIAGATDNLSFAFHWLQTAWDAADTTLTEDIVRDVRSDAVDRYREALLDDFTLHHKRLLTAIVQVDEEQGASPVRSGHVYRRYEHLCRSADEDALTTRRISDYLKHLEILGIIQADYHYGGSEGKTREIQLQEI